MRRLILSTVAGACAAWLAASPAAANGPLPAGCGSATRAACIYTPAASFAATATFDTVLTDAARNNYRLPVRVRYPMGANTPMPVIIYNHGGGPTATGHTRVNSQAWPIVWAKAGYIVISPSRAPQPTPNAGELAICAAHTVGPPSCPNFLGHTIYGPANTDFLIGRLSALQAAIPALNGLVRSDKVIVAGWSGGSTVPMGNAGATRQMNTTTPVLSQKSTKPIGFFGIATMGPDYAGYDAGYQSTSYDTIDGRPFFFVTGRGDTNGKPSEPRTTAWLRSRPGGKFLSYARSLLVTHGTVNLSDCGTTLRKTHCAWMTSAGLAFVDAVAKGRPTAKAWIASDAYEVLTDGAIEFHDR